MRSILVVVALAACGKQPEQPPPKVAEPAPKPAEPAPKAAPDERWSATLVVGANFKELVVHFANGAAAFEGLTPEPLPLEGVTLAPDRLAFTLKKEKGSEVYELARTGDTAKGEGRIGSHTLKIRMVKLAEGEAPHSAYLRPQTPVPPFPYDQREVAIDAPDGGKLAGTLTLPKGVARAPALLLWSGSGQEDRDETIYGHKPFLVLADRLTRAGIAVLRLDDRATGKTIGAVGSLDTEIADAGAAIDYLAKQPEIDPKRIGMAGHSTGGMVVPNVALAHRVAFAVSLAGVAVPGRDLVLLQQVALAKANGTTVPPEQAALQKQLGEAAVKGPDEVKRVLLEVAGPQLEKALGRKPTQAEIDQAIAKPLADISQPWTLLLLPDRSARRLEEAQDPGAAGRGRSRHAGACRRDDRRAHRCARQAVRGHHAQAARAQSHVPAREDRAARRVPRDHGDLRSGDARAHRDVARGAVIRLATTDDVAAAPVVHVARADLSRRAASAIAASLPDATSRGRYFIPQSGARITRSGAMCCSARCTRSTMTSGVSIAMSERSRQPTMICLPASSASTLQSSFDCAVSTEICAHGAAASSRRNE